MTLTTLPESLKPAVKKVARDLVHPEVPDAWEEDCKECEEWTERVFLAVLNAAIEAGGAYRSDEIFDTGTALILRIGDTP